MDLLNTYRQLVQDAESILQVPDDVLVTLTIPQVDEIVKMYTTLTPSTDYKTHTANVRAFRHRYIHAEGLDPVGGWKVSLRGTVPS